MRRAVPLWAVVCVFAAVGSSSAKVCGDDVGGQDVPCACGDVVTGNVTLSDDPIVGASCDGDGLVIRAPDASGGVTVDLNGKTLRGGKHGAGLWIVDGGPGGARVVSSGARAHIEGYRDGIVARGDRAVVLVENVDVRGAERDGVRLAGNDYEIRAVEVADVGRDGISLDGRDYRCNGNHVVRSGRHGFFLDGENAIIGKAGGGNAAEAAGSDGFHLRGTGMRLNVCSAVANRGDGVGLRGAGHEVTACTARENEEDGIAGEGGSMAFFLNRAETNGRNGLRITGVRLNDGGGNVGSGNRGAGQQRPPVDCEIGGAPCRP